MELVIITDGRKKGLLEHTAINSILAPFNPSSTKQSLNLGNKSYHYVTIDDNSPLSRITNELIKLDGVESVYEKPRDFPPM